MSEEKFNPGDSRRTKVLVVCADGSIDGHRCYPIAFRKSDGASIVVASTDGEKFHWGRLYQTEIRNEDHHPYVVKEVTNVPADNEWRLIEEEIDERAGHPDFAEGSG